MGKRIFFVGAGALGGYVGGHLTRAGQDVTFIDPWPEHVEQMRSAGVHVSGTQGDYRVPVNALHIADVQRLIRKPVDIAIIATKSFDTTWAARLIVPVLGTGLATVMTSAT